MHSDPFAEGVRHQSECSILPNSLMLFQRKGRHVGLILRPYRGEHDYGPAGERAMREKRADSFACGTQVVWDVDWQSETNLVSLLLAGFVGVPQDLWLPDDSPHGLLIRHGGDGERYRWWGSAAHYPTF